jgi:CheY-like chemotaxis protein
MDNSPFNILLVEDDEIDIMNVKRAFKKCNITNPLYLAANGLEALAMLKNESANTLNLPIKKVIILLDLNMPKMSGIEFLQQLRADPALKLIPVIVLTTSSEKQDRAQAYELNVAGYIIKPIVFNQFVETMATLYKYWTLCKMP